MGARAPGGRRRAGGPHWHSRAVWPWPWTLPPAVSAGANPGRLATPAGSQFAQPGPYNRRARKSLILLGERMYGHAHMHGAVLVRRRMQLAPI
jgi:hypothetical protein